MSQQALLVGGHYTALLQYTTGIEVGPFGCHAEPVGALTLQLRWEQTGEIVWKQVRCEIPGAADTVGTHLERQLRAAERVLGTQFTLL